MNGLMAGKRGLIMGLANDRSLAWGIAQKLSEAGAELAFSYQGEALEKRVRPLAEQLGTARLIDCDVSDMDALDATFAKLGEEWPTLDFVVHAIGFSDKNELRGKYVDTSLENFLLTMNISAYSFVAVAKRANAHDFIMKFADGYDTVIGERGLRLSGGQRQRVAVARAMLKDAPILILDEATSALDTKAERAVQAGLDELMVGRTTLMIAHRLSTIAGVDTIITLRDGRVDEIGSPAELAVSGGIYTELLRLTASSSAADRERLKAFGFHVDGDGDGDGDGDDEDEDGGSSERN